MPFCPKCGYEYKPNVSICPDCQEKLVAKLPDKTGTRAAGTTLGEYRDWVPVIRLHSSAMGQMVYEALVNKEIPVVIKAGSRYFGRSITGDAGPFNPVIGGEVLFVPRKFMSEAVKEAEVILGNEYDKWRIENVEK